MHIIEIIRPGQWLFRKTTAPSRPTNKLESARKAEAAKDNKNSHSNTFL
jgi:hypothetical protein